jgi:hypothetical protein
LNKHELIVKTIRESNLSIQQWADQIGMHRNQVQNWLSGRTTNIRDSSVVAVGKVISKKPRFNESGVEWVELDHEQIEVKEIKMSVNAERIIENQQTTIDLLKEKIAILENRLKKNDGYLDMMKKEPKCKRCLDIIGKA